MDKKTEVNQRATKKNRKRAVHKWIMAIVAASMVASMVAGVVAPAVSAKAEPQAPAQTETPKKKGTPVGTWYGKIFGMSVVLNLKDGGAYCIDFEGRNEETGTWIMDGDNVITDKGDNSETTYIFNGDSLITKVRRNYVNPLSSLLLPGSYGASSNLSTKCYFFRMLNVVKHKTRQLNDCHSVWCR